MMYQCDHMDCIHKFWVELDTLHKQVTCPKCKRKGSVIVGFVVSVNNKDVVRKGLPNWIDDRITEAIEWLEE